MGGYYYYYQCSELVSRKTSFHIVVVQIIFHKFIQQIVEKHCSLVFGCNMLKTMFNAGRFLSKSESACALIDLLAKCIENQIL